MLKIRPDLQVLWRSPTSLQFGAPDPAVVIDDIDDGVDWLISRARSGTTRKQAIAVAVRHGASVARAEHVLEALAPLFEAESPDGGSAQARSTVHLALRTTSVDASVLDIVQRRADDVGVPVRRLEPDELPHATDVHLEVAHYVVPPPRLQPLMASDIAHLAIVLGDQSIDVTPLVVPGQTPCVRCAGLRRTDIDPSWPIVAAQLSNRRCAPHHAADLDSAIRLAIRAATRSARDASTPSLAHRISRGSDVAIMSKWSFHGECGCQGVPGSERVDAPRLDHQLSSSSTAAMLAPE